MPQAHRHEDGYGHLMAHVDEHSFKSRLHRWRFNLTDGTTREEHLRRPRARIRHDQPAFCRPALSLRLSTTAKPGWFLFNGFVKHDLVTGESWSLPLAEGRYASESPFAPRVGAVDEDDGYLVSFIIDENRGTSECVLIDCKNFERDRCAGSRCRTRFRAGRMRIGRTGVCCGRRGRRCGRRPNLPQP